LGANYGETEKRRISVSAEKRSEMFLVEFFSLHEVQVETETVKRPKNGPKEMATVRNSHPRLQTESS
jgi:hypothetical protein